VNPIPEARRRVTAAVGPTIEDPSPASRCARVIEAHTPQVLAWTEDTAGAPRPVNVLGQDS